jgi:TrpR family trp operon transcriptional repressor
VATIRDVARILARLEDEALVEDFLVSILTPREISEVARRWELVRLLDQGMSQRSVARRLGMSLCKITRGSRELKKRNSAFRRVLRQYVTP